MPHALAQQQGNKPVVQSPTLSKFLNITCIFILLLFFLCVFFSTLYIKGRFLSNAGMCFGGVVVAIDTVLRSLKGKIC